MVRINRALRFLFVLLVVRPIVFILIGVNLRGREKLPAQGPAIVIANHNSHLDTAILVSLFPMRTLHLVHPVAAADYWLKNPFLRWFSLNLAGIIPIRRSRDPKITDDPLASISKALEEGQIIIYYPEGTRGEPEHISHFKSGISRLSEKHPKVPLIPIFMHGTGKALPRGEGLLIPFCANIWVGEPLYWNGDKNTFTPWLESKILEMAERAKAPKWE
jgi:1-acyl-sn-glycerol-3-phosphate acyltransferase